MPFVLAVTVNILKEDIVVVCSRQHPYRRFVCRQFFKCMILIRYLLSGGRHRCGVGNTERIAADGDGRCRRSDRTVDGVCRRCGVDLRFVIQFKDAAFEGIVVMVFFQDRHIACFPRVEVFHMNYFVRGCDGKRLAETAFISCGRLHFQKCITSVHDVLDRSDHAVIICAVHIWDMIALRGIPEFSDFLCQNAVTVFQYLIRCCIILSFTAVTAVLMHFVWDHLQQVIRGIRQTDGLVCCVHLDKRDRNLFDFLKVADTVLCGSISLNKAAFIICRCCRCACAFCIHSEIAGSFSRQEALNISDLCQAVCVHRQLCKPYLSVCSRFYNIASGWISIILVGNILSVAVFDNIERCVVRLGIRSCIIRQFKFCSAQYDIFIKTADMSVVSIIICLVDLDDFCFACDLGVGDCHCQRSVRSRFL